MLKTTNSTVSASSISALTSATTPLAGTEVLPIVQSGSTVKVAVSDLTAGRAVATGALSVTGIVGATGDLWTTHDTDLGGVYLTAGTNTPPGAGHRFALVRKNSIGGGGALLSAYGPVGFEVGATGGAIGSGTTAVVIDTNSNIVPQVAAKGINFTANTPKAGMTSQLLNWYEEGTWTPTIDFAGGTSGITYSSQAGRYTRIGRQVTISFDIVLSSKGSSTGNLNINGIPFTQAGARSSAILGYVTGTLPYSVPVNFYVGGTQISFNPGGTQGLSDVTLANNSELIGSITYSV